MTGDRDRDRRDPDTLKGGANGVVGSAAGFGVGTVIGTAMGLAVGGPVGMLVGGTVGALIGGVAGYSIDYESHEPAFRDYHGAFRPQAQQQPLAIAQGPSPDMLRHTFEDASPAYRYGWESRGNPEFHDHTYDKARPALHEGWTGSGDFADYEDYVKHGWERRAASMAAGSMSPAAKE
jgi:hypothetical protein